MMKKKILFINGHLNAGGVEKALVDVLKHLDYSRFDVDLLLLEDLGDYAQDVPEQVNLVFRSLVNTYGSLPKCLLRCVKQRDWFSLRIRLIFLIMKLLGQKHIRWSRKLLTDNKHYDCVVSFRPGICTQIAAFACNADRRITWWHHGEINVEPQSYLETASACDTVAVVSDACRKMLQETFPTLQSKMAVIPNILDTEQIRLKAEAFSPYAGNDTFHIVSVGRLAEEKHFENAIYAARCLKERGHTFRWHLVGDGVMRDALQEKAAEAGVADCFIFECNQPNPYPYMKNANLFVHPSYVESFGIVVAEAMTLGIPCVVTKSLGPCEFIEDGINGVLTEQNPESMTEKVLETLTNHELYQYIKSNTRCPEQFLPERVMVAIYQIIG